MKTLIILLLLFQISTAICGQTKSALNLSFEETENGKPLGWDAFGNNDYVLQLDSAIKQDGKYAFAISYDKDEPDYKAVAFTLPHNYNGKKITLTGYIKTENVTGGYAGLWMRIDPNIAFDNMDGRGIKGTTGWQKYEVTLNMKPDQTKAIVFGGLLIGKGKMWLDDLHVTIDGKDIEKLKPYEKKLTRAEQDTAFKSGSGILNINTDATTLKNLNVLGLLWGFLKYYHPAIAAGDYNWDAELFRVLPQILDAKTEAQRDDVLIAWINKLGSIPAAKNIMAETGNIKMQPDLDWITSNDISPQLSKLLVQIRDAKRSKENYYVDLAQDVNNPVFNHEDGYENMLYPDAGYRVLSLYRYWNIIQYYFPYKYAIGVDWKTVLPSFLPKFINAKNELEYDLAALELIASIHDTHANIWGGAQALSTYFGERYATPSITFIDNKAVVDGFRNDTLSASGVKPGDIITSVNGKNVDTIIAQNLNRFPASNYPTQLRDLAFNLLRTNDSVVNITYTEDGESKTASLKTYPYNATVNHSRFSRNDTDFKMINAQTAYLYLGSIKSKDLPVVFEKIKNTKGLIIDLRCYPSEFVVFSLGKYLMPKKTPFVKFTNTSVDHAGLLTFTEPLSVGENNGDYYKGKVVLLINEITWSQAEYTTMAFRVAPNATVIGSTTSAADGNVSPFFLPGGISTMISGIGVYYPDGKETQRVGIIPDIEVKPTVEGIKNGRDEVLEKAIKIIEQ